MNPLSLRIGLASALIFAAAALAANVEEKYDSGKLKVKYNVDGQGRKEGLYQEFYASGKIKARATYKADKLSGPYTEYDEKGKKTLAATYKDGKLNGNLFRYENGLPILSQPFKDGEAVFPKSREKIAATLKTIFENAKPGPDEASQRDLALRRLKAYRYLCDLPYQDLALDDSYNRQAHAAAATLAFESCPQRGRGRGADARMAFERGLDLAELDPEAVDLHLRIFPAEELDRSVGPVPSEVSGPIEPLAGDEDRRRSVTRSGLRRSSISSQRRCRRYGAARLPKRAWDPSTRRGRGRSDSPAACRTECSATPDQDASLARRSTRSKPPSRLQATSP